MSNANCKWDYEYFMTSDTLIYKCWICGKQVNKAIERICPQEQIKDSFESCELNWTEPEFVYYCRKCDFKSNKAICKFQQMGTEPKPRFVLDLPPFRPKLMILGHARHGKDTLCELLRDHWDLSFISSSWACAEEVCFPAMAPAYGYKSVEECFADRANHRQEWFELIAEFNSKDLTRLGRLIYQKADVYCGIRNAREFHALRNAGLIDYTIWLDASMRVGAEPSSSISVKAWMADYVLDNNDDLPTLRIRLADLMKTLERRSINGEAK